MEIKEVDVNEWYRLSSLSGNNSICFQPEFILIIAQSFSIVPVCWIVYRNEQPVIGLLSYRKKGALVHPSVYTYTAIWTASSSFMVQQALMLLLAHLKSKFTRIHFWLPPEITDIRPFIRSGFRPAVNYTLLKSLEDLKFSTQLRAREKKAESYNVRFLWDDKQSDIMEQYNREFSSYGYGAKHGNQLSLFFSALLKGGFAKSLSGRIENKLVASGIVLVDEPRKHSMNMLISSEKKHYDTGVHSALYMHIFRNLREEGYLTNDLYGANTLGIGNFKSNFTNNLLPHYEVKYNARLRAILDFRHNFKKRLLRFFR